VIKRFLIGAVLGLCATVSSAEIISLSARVSLVDAPDGGGGPLTILAPVLPANAFFGKDAVIPVEIISQGQTISTQGLRVEIGYQLVDVSSNPIGSLSRVPVLLTRDPRRTNALLGTATIPRTDLIGLQQGGRLQYYFRAEQIAGDTVLSAGGVSQAPAGTSATALPSNPFNSAIIQELRTPVQAQGATVSVPDLSLVDGDTSIQFPAGAFSEDASLLIRQLNPNGWPAGPRGAKPVLVYSMGLEGTELLTKADVTLSYSADPQGRVSGTESSGEDLALYYWDGFEWRLVDRPRIDTTLRTVSATTNRLATFALLPTGRVGAADVRARERIITPNGDGINDEAGFSSLSIEEIKIFDIRGRRVRTLGPSNTCSVLSGICWDGRSDDGGIVESGVYIYQYVSQGERVSGVIAVAK